MAVAVGAPPSVSVIILGSRREALARCLESLAAAGEPAPAEVIVALNGAGGPRPAELAPWRARLPLTLLELPASPLGRARNAALRAARGETLLFLDDDAAVPAGYFARLAATLARYPEADVLGGPNLTPAGSARFQRWAGAVLSSPAGAGPMRRRYAGYARDTWVDDAGLMLCNLAVRRRALAEEGLAFPEDLARNEENVLLERLRRRGRRALHAPALAVAHERRATLAAFLAQCALSGLGRGQMTRRWPGSLKPIHLLPAAALVASALAPRLAAGGLAAYALAAAASAWASSPLWGDRAAVAALIPCAHAAYALGFLAGLAGRRRR